MRCSYLEKVYLQIVYVIWGWIIEGDCYDIC